MIHLVIGGTYSGKSTFVKKQFLPRGGAQCIFRGVPITSHGPLCAIGHYNEEIRTMGVDQMGRDYKRVREKIKIFLDGVYNHCYFHVAMEGNALMDRPFMENLRHAGYDVKLWLMNPSAKEIEKRLKENKCKYGRSIIAMTYKRAWSVWNEYGKVFIHEVVS